MKPCLDYAIDYVTSHPKTEYQLRIQLLKKWYHEDTIEKTIKYMKSQDFVNDKKYVEMYLDSECVSKWKPFKVVKSWLIKKWVEKKIIKDVCYNMEKKIKNWIIKWIKKSINYHKKNWENWFDIIRKLLEKWYNLEDIKRAL